MPSTDHKYQALLAVSQAIVSHRELSALFHELAGRLHQVVRFDYLALYLHETTSNTMRIHVLEGTEPVPLPSAAVLPIHVRLTHSLFASDIPRGLLGRVSLAKPTSAPLLC